MSKQKTHDKWPTVDGLRIGHLNIHYAINKIPEIASILNNSDTPFHIFGLTETHLGDNVSTDEISIPGYRVERRSVKKSLETGIAVYISQTIKAERLPHLEDYNVESIWLKIYLKNHAPFILGFLYRNPKERSCWVDNFSLMVDAVLLQSQEYILLGDFNIDLLKPNPHWKTATELCNLTQLVETPTRVTNNTTTLIDHIYTTHSKHIAEVCVPTFGCSDHYPVCVTWKKRNVKIPKTGHKVISFRSLKNFDKDIFLNDLKNSHLQTVYNLTDPDEALDFWLKTFMDIYNKHAPRLTKRVKHYRKPGWLDKEIDSAIKVRDDLKKSGQEDAYKQQRNFVTKLKRSKIKAHINKLVESGANTRSIWKAINQLTNKSNASTPNTDISPDVFNTHFTTIASKVIKEDKSNTNTLEKLQEFCSSKKINSELNIPLMTVVDVYNSLLKLKQTNTAGFDELDGKILKMAAPIITETLTYIYNLCISKSYYPTMFKRAKVIPLYKSGDVTDPSNYRPISILSNLSKPMEKHMNKHLQTHLAKYNLLHDSQSGFRPLHSCHTALVTMLDKWLTHINEDNLCGVLFVDFAKAFDCIEHSLLLRKLKHYHIQSSTLQLLTSFVTDRQQSVCVGKVTSSSAEIRNGVPQGSVLGPLLFSIYINDLPLHISNSDCGMFADDTTLHTSNKKLKPLATSLQNTANELQAWSDLNHMALHPQKTEVMIVTSRQKRQNISLSLPPIQLGNQTLTEVDSHKTLGVIIDNNLSWTKHIHYLSKHISKKTYQLSRIKHFLNVSGRKSYFAAHIQSAIDYASTLWDSASGNAMKPLRSIHRRAIKAVLKKPKLSNEDYKLHDILPLTDRLKHNKIMLMHKIVSEAAPNTLKSSFSLNTSRNKCIFHVPIPRVDLFKSSLKYSGSLLWNKLPQNLRLGRLNSIAFKKHTKHFLHNYSS